MRTSLYAFLRDKDSREWSLADGRVWPRRLRFGGMRAHGNDPARSLKYFNNSLLFYLNVCDFSSSATVELQYARLL